VTIPATIINLLDDPEYWDGFFININTQDNLIYRHTDVLRSLEYQLAVAMFLLASYCLESTYFSSLVLFYLQ
jgi:hypothetical protein